jgi:hypothetical protein
MARTTSTTPITRPALTTVNALPVRRTSDTGPPVTT